MEKVRLKIVDSKNIYGTMNGGTIRLTNITESDKKMLADEHRLTSEELQNYAFTPADKKKIFTIHRKMFAEEEQFDWHKMFMADQVDKNGSYFEITEEYTRQNPNGWTDINEDILVITDKNPDVEKTIIIHNNTIFPNCTISSPLRPSIVSPAISCTSTNIS